MIQILKMAFRDLGRNRRRSFFSALALAMGLALLLLMAAVVSGEIRDSMNSSIKLETGHLQIQAASYNVDKASLAWEDLIADPQTIASQIAAMAPVKAASPRLFASGIVNTGEDTYGVRIIGIDPASPASAPYRDGLVTGTFLQPEDNSGILVGLALADKIGLKAGEQVSLLINTSNGDTDQQNFTVRGIFSTKIPSYDETTVFLPLAKAQTFAQAGNHASIIFVLLNDSQQTDTVAQAIQSTQYKVQTYQQLNSLLVTFDTFANVLLFFFYLIVLGITATVIVNTLIMSVFERTREIGIMSAIGMKSGRIMTLFFAESGLLAIGGILMGLVLGGIMVFYATKYGIYLGGNYGVTGILMGERLYGYLTVSDTVTLTITAFVVTLLAALYPALLAARMEPVEALHGGK